MCVAVEGLDLADSPCGSERSDETISYKVRIKGNGTPEQFQEIHENVMKTSPNYFNVTQPIRIDAELEVE